MPRLVPTCVLCASNQHRCVRGTVHFCAQAVSTRRYVAALARVAQALFAERGIASLPTTQLWKGGELLQEVGSMGLEKALLALGGEPV